MMEVSVIILTFNEEKHIERCIKSLKGIAREVLIIDSFSSDETVALAESLGASVWQREFITQAEQFQWALENLPIKTEWVMRMDADEYLEPALVEEIRQILPGLPLDIQGVYIKRKVFFMGKWIRHGGFYPHILLRIWRRGKGHIEQRWMDEHIVIPSGGKTVTLREHMVDDNQKGITFWIVKHNSYATREMVDLLNIKYSLTAHDEIIFSTNTSQAVIKRYLKERIYAKMPLTFRAAVYFLYRYFFRLGFLDGGRGFLWHFLQGFWYRLLVDIKVQEVENRCKGDVEMMKKMLCIEYGVQL